MTAPVFSPTDQPKAILDGSGRWLADSMPGFRWLKSRGNLDRKVLSQIHRVHLQSSKRSRAGIATWVSPRLTVIDDRLQEWRGIHPTQSAAANPGDAAPIVFNSLFINFLKQWSSIEMSGLPQPAAGPRSVDLNELLTCLVETVLPTLEHFIEPSSLVANLPPSWWSMIDVGTVEWALACDDRSSAAAFVRGHMERPLKGQQKAEQRLSLFHDGWEANRRGERAKGHPTSLEGLGWLSAAHNLIEPDSLQPAT